MEPIFKKEDLLQLSPFRELPTRQPYAQHYDAMVDCIQVAQKVEPAEIIGRLLEKSCYYCGISTTWRTILYTFAEGILCLHKELWNDEELKEERIFLHNHFKRFYPEYKGEFENYDITLLQPAEEWFYSFKMWQDGFVSDDLKPAFSYGMYSNFKLATEFFSFVDEEFLETLEELEEDE